MKYISLLLVLIFLACTDKTNDKADITIVGEWETIKIDYPKVDTLDVEILPITGIAKLGFSFNEDGSCETYPGITDPVASKRMFQYLGGFSKYRVEDDSLYLTHTKFKKPKVYKIERITADTLILNDILRYTLVKRKYDLRDSADFDGIIVSSSSCFGKCPVNDVYLKNTGEVWLNTQFHNSLEGFYVSKISNKEFQKFALPFKKAEYHKLESEYSAGYTDGATIDVAFIKNGKIIKSVSDYGNAGPVKFKWAYEPLTYLSQILRFKRDLSVKRFEIGYAAFTDKENKLSLSGAESYYLSHLLNKYVESERRNFIEKYLVRGCYNEDVTKVSSDGRFYKFYYKDKSSEVIDIGANFLEGKLVNKFEKI